MESAKPVEVGSDEALREELRALREKVAELEERKDPPSADIVLSKYDLNDNEKTVLRLLALGEGQRKSSRMAYLHEEYVKNRIKASSDFAHAYQEVRDEFDAWQEARLRFSLSGVWREIDYLIQVDPEEFIEEDNTDYARALLKAKTAAIGLVMRHGYTQKTEVTHQHEVNVPMLQVAQENMSLIAEHLMKLSTAASTGSLEDRLPENQIIDLYPAEHALTFKKQVIREDGRRRCFECGKWIVNLEKHLSLQHNMDRKQYIVKHNLDPMEPFDAAGSHSTD